MEVFSIAQRGHLTRLHLVVNTIPIIPESDDLPELVDWTELEISESNYNSVVTEPKYDPVIVEPKEWFEIWVL